MAKLMLVEDDNNLREIYQARLAAEGYDIVSAKDGEEALAIAVKEKPDLIICDVMMPKVSGFEMLDILRSTPEIKNTKVIMMTALSQAQDKAHAEKLGADRYLVKSQVTLEDMAKTVRDVLQEGGLSQTQTPTPTPPSEPAVAPTTTSPVAVTPPTDIPVVTTVAPPAPVTTAPEQLLNKVANTLSEAISTTTPAFESEVVEPPSVPPVPLSTNNDDDNDNVTVAKKKIIQPINDLNPSKTDLNLLLAREVAKEQANMAPTAGVINDTKNSSMSTTVPQEPSAPTESGGIPHHLDVVPPQPENTDPNSIAL